MTVAKLLSVNSNVLMYTRRQEVRDKINKDRFYKDVPIPDNILAVDNMKVVCEQCNVIFPVVPSSGFRSMMKDLAEYLKPHHIMIHGTKGLDISLISPEQIESGTFDKSMVHPMSEVILQESSVLRVGCISGPNLAREILKGQPAATVIASDYKEVIEKGEELLGGPNFFVFGSYDLKGAELAGAYKNIIAIGSGILAGLGYGKNMQSLIITRGLREMIQFGEALGADRKSFLGTAGIGDLVATATSEDSRNHTFGFRLAQGETKDEILKSMDEVVEGVNTLKVVQIIAVKEKLELPITFLLYKVLFQGYNIQRALNYLMSYNYAPDVDFI